MKKFSLIFLAITFLAKIALAIPFQPQVVTINGYPVENWQGGEAEITFDLEGRYCTVYLCVYTKDQGQNIPLTNTPDVRRGTGLFYHYVSGIDTAVYVSMGEFFPVGSGHTITWDGIDKVGREMPAVDYTYYLLAVDEGATGYASIAVGIDLWDGPDGSIFTQYNRSDGTALERPRVWKGFSYVELGQDTESAERVEFTPPAGIQPHPTIAIDSGDNNIIYFQAGDSEREEAFISKAVLNTDGPAEIITAFGENGFYYFSNQYWNSTGFGGPGVSYQNGRLITTSTSLSEKSSSVHVIDSSTGEGLRVIDLSDWYAGEDFDAEAMGPNQTIFSKITPGLVHTVSPVSCMRLALDISKQDALVWSNGNGDYYCDKNYPGYYDENREWICHDAVAGLFNHCVETDEYDFSYFNSNKAGMAHAMVLGPDGYGLCFIIGSLNSAIPDDVFFKMYSWFTLIHENTSFDGFYIYTPFVVNYEPFELELKSSWQGYDICKGIITTGVGIKEETPVTYALSNAPNPFNPTTTITYSIAKPDHVILDVFNILGQKVDTLFEGHHDAGTYSIRWDASGQANGIYITVMKAGEITKTEKMILMK